MSRMKLVVAAVLVAGLAWSPLPAVAAATETVVPSELPAGPPLQAASIDAATHVLTRPGHEPVTVLPDGGWAGSLFRVRGGYLVSLSFNNGKRPTERLVHVGDDGTQRVVRERWAFKPTAVAGDGRSFIAVRHRLHRRGVSEAFVIQRFGTADGRALGKALVRPFRYVMPRALVVTPTVVTLITAQRVGRRGSETRTERWNTRTGRVRVVARNPTTAEHEDSLLSWAASRRAHVVGVERGRRQVALDTRTLERLWRTRPGEVLLAFAPDDRSVITASGGTVIDQGTVGAVKKLAVRSARTGKVLVEFAGFFAYRASTLPSSQSLGWETSDSFVAYAYDDVVPGDDYATPVGPALVRCTVSTASCERIGDHGVVLAERPSH